MTKIAGSGSISRRHGSADPDPYQIVMHHAILNTANKYNYYKKAPPHISKKKYLDRVYLGHVDSVCDVSLVLGGGEGPEPFHEALVQL
jgi:hypothetical protein